MKDKLTANLNFFVRQYINLGWAVAGRAALRDRIVDALRTALQGQGLLR